MRTFVIGGKPVDFSSASEALIAVSEAGLETVMELNGWESAVWTKRGGFVVDDKENKGPFMNVAYADGRRRTHAVSLLQGNLFSTGKTVEHAMRSMLTNVEDAWSGLFVGTTPCDDFDVSYHPLTIRKDSVWTPGNYRTIPLVGITCHEVPRYKDKYRGSLGPYLLPNGRFGLVWGGSDSLVYNTWRPFVTGPEAMEDTITSLILNTIIPVAYHESYEFRNICDAQEAIAKVEAVLNAYEASKTHKEEP